MLCFLKDIRIILIVLFSIVILNNNDTYSQEIQDKTDYTNLDNVLMRYNQIQNSQVNKIENDKNLYIFISFSMPNKMIKNYFIESQILKKKYNTNIVFVLRGFYKNSFKATAEKIGLLLKDLNKKDVAIIIDPINFKKYQIKQVPAFLQKYDKEKYDVMFGATNIEYFMELVKDKNDK